MYFYFFAALIFITLSICIYAIFVEPRRLTITRHRINSDLLPKGFHGVTIVQFGDTHIGPQYSLAQLEHLVTTLNSLKPDVVVFTGDLFDARRKINFASYDPTTTLASIRAQLGKFAVYGNHDFGYARIVRLSGPFLQGAGFEMLLNESKRITLPSGEYITLAGLDDYVCGKPNPRSAFTKLDADGFNLLLVHEPDVADRFTRYPIALQLSGHSHGGQVSLPILGPLIKTSLGRRYISGLYRVQDKLRAERPYMLYVNRGIGTTRIKVRIGSVPEVSVFTLLCK
jgi:predicted MPP superfamily phosphohydrolase